MGKVISMAPIPEVRAFNAGYEDGWLDRPKKEGELQGYYRGFAAGTEDRLEEEHAKASGDFDGLTPEEEEEIYGTTDRI